MVADAAQPWAGPEAQCNTVRMLKFALTQFGPGFLAFDRSLDRQSALHPVKDKLEICVVFYVSCQV